MSWTVKYTNQAREDIKAIYEYIAFELLVPDTATGQIQRIFKMVRELDEMPMRFKLYEDEPWKSKGLRFVPVDNYLIFYLLIDETNTVSIVRIIYAGRDMNKQLQETEI